MVVALYAGPESDTPTLPERLLTPGRITASSHINHGPEHRQQTFWVMKDGKPTREPEFLHDSADGVVGPLQ